jgi:hypothetical protein
MRFVMSLVTIGVLLGWSIVSVAESRNPRVVGDQEAGLVVGGTCYTVAGNDDWCAAYHVPSGITECTTQNPGCTKDASVPYIQSSNPGNSTTAKQCVDEPACTYYTTTTTSCGG